MDPTPSSIEETDRPWSTRWARGGRSSCESGDMADIRFQSLEDGDLADIWYALGGATTRHPDHFKQLTDDALNELIARRGDGLNPWLEKRFRPFRLQDSKEDADVNIRDCRSADL